MNNLVRHFPHLQLWILRFRAGKDLPRFIQQVCSRPDGDMAQKGENEIVESSMLWIKKGLGLNFTLALTCWVTLAKCLNLSVPSCPHQ